MNAGVRCHNESQREAVSRRDRRVARICDDVQLSSGDLRAGNRRSSVAEPHHQTRDRVAFDIEVFEEPRCHLSLPVEDECAWERNPDHAGVRPDDGHVLLYLGLDRWIVFVWSSSPFRNGIENAVLFNGC